MVADKEMKNIKRVIWLFLLAIALSSPTPSVASLLSTATLLKPPPTPKPTATPTLFPSPTATPVKPKPTATPTPFPSPTPTPTPILLPISVEQDASHYDQHAEFMAFKSEHECESSNFRDNAQSISPYTKASVESIVATLDSWAAAVRGEIRIAPCAEGRKDEDKIIFDMMNKFKLAKNLVVYIEAKMGASSEVPDFGSGIIFNMTKQFLYIVTANHLVRNGPKKELQDIRIEFNFIPNDFIEAKLLPSEGRERDIAVVRVRLKDIKDFSFDSLKVLIPFTQIFFRSNLKDLRIGETLYPLGHPSGTKWKIFPDPAKFDSINDGEILFADDLYDGQSGGGIFDSQWNLIGLIQTERSVLFLYEF